MPFFTIYSNKGVRKEFIYARDDAHAFQMFNQQTPDPDACIESGFDFGRVYDFYKKKWVGASSQPESIDFYSAATLLTEQGLLRLYTAQVVELLTEAWRRHGIDSVEVLHTPDPEVLVRIQDLEKTWFLRVQKYLEDMTEEERAAVDRRDFGKRYVATTVNDVIKILEKQRDLGRGNYVIARSADPYRPNSPTGISVKVAQLMLWINDYDSE